MQVGSRLNPGGSTSALREDVLAALGVFKVATAHQLWELTRAGWQDNKGIRNALNDLVKHGLVVSDGNTRPRRQKPPKRGQKAVPRPAAAPDDGKAGAGNKQPKARKLWRLTPAGLEAAAQLLPAEREMGGTARGAGRHGAEHAMAVNATILAFIQPRPGDYDDDEDVDDQDVDVVEQLEADDDQEPEADAPARGPRPPGIGTIASWTTEVTLPITGSVSAASKGSPRPDAVLVAPEADPPLPFLCVEVDNGTESPAVIAAKFDRYRRFFRRTITDTGGTGRSRGRTIPFWRTLYADAGREGHPPVAVVFTGTGPRSLANRQAKLHDLSRPYWAGHPRRNSFTDRAEYLEYDDSIPILATTLKQLRTHGPYGPIWWRYGHADHHQTLADALANPRGERAAFERRQRQEEAEQARREAEEAERERRRPVCTSCAEKFTDSRWSTIQTWPDDPYPTLCDDCAAAARQRAETARQAAEAEAARAAEEAQGRSRFGRRRRG